VAAETETIHATTIARHGHAVLLRGTSGAGKSDLALRAIMRPLLLPGDASPAPFELVSDDRTVLHLAGDSVVASAPEPLRGLLEVRGIGIVALPSLGDVPLALVVDLSAGEIERLPEYPGARTTLLGRAFDVVEIAPFEASAPEKVALALARATAWRDGNTV
jgi:serine kinase of HPr protein (carbohydrate metabolism regulator)